MAIGRASASPEKEHDGTADKQIDTPPPLFELASADGSVASHHRPGRINA